MYNPLYDTLEPSFLLHTMLKGAVVSTMFIFGAFFTWLLPRLVPIDDNATKGLRHTCAMALFFVGIACLGGVLTNLFVRSRELHEVVNIMLVIANNAAILMVLMPGYALVKGKVPPPDVFLLYMLPLAAYMVLFAFFNEKWAINLTNILTLVYATIIVIYQFYQVERRQRHIKDIISDTKDREVRWYITTMTPYLLLSAFFAVVFASHKEAIAIIYNVMTIIVTAFLVWRFSRQRLDYLEATATHTTPAIKVNSIDGNENLTQDDISTRLSQLEHTFFFLKANYNISEMSDALNVPTDQLVHYLHATRNTTFYEYVNTLRLNYSRRLLSDPDIDMQEVAHRSGYSDFITFRKLFVERYSQTPMQYRLNNI